MMSTKRIAASLLTAGALIISLAPPAAANDITVNVRYEGRLDGRGTWDDNVDTLCAVGLGAVTNLPTVDRVRARIVRQNGDGPNFVIVDNSPFGSTPTCTGNLSIPEDQPYRMRVTVFYIQGGITRTNTGDFFS